MSGTTSSRDTAEMPSLLLIEEAVHGLRHTSATTLFWYYLGAGPWVIGFLYFWAYASWFAPDSPRLAWLGLILAGLFVWLKTTQSVFCARLMAQRLGTAPAPVTVKGLLRIAAAQLRVHVWAIAVLPLSALLTLPFGWAWTFYQNATVLGAGNAREPLVATSWAQAKLWPRQAHLLLLIGGILSLYVWVNLAVACHLVPWLANRLLGLENVMNFRGWSWLNTTFIASATALTWLAVDPLIKAVYVLRVFYGKARRTGEDLRIELEAARPRRRMPAVNSLLLLVIVQVVSNHLPAQTSASAPAVQAGGLDQAIDEVLARQEFAWQLRPLPQSGISAESEDGAVRAFFRQGLKWLSEAFDWVRQLFQRFENWLDDRFSPENKTSKPGQAARGAPAGLKAFLYVLIGIVLVLIVVLVVISWRNSRRRPGAIVAAGAVAEAQPDLRDENIQAAQLPADGWLALAREQLAQGETRLALRALYLASLARLGARELLTLAKFKTNLDYERELRRRAPARPGLLVWFAGRRGEFEAVWYGRAQPEAGRLTGWLAELEEDRLP